jgi:hypothetical protein
VRSGRERANERTNEGDDVSGANETNANVCVITRHLSRNERLLALLARSPRRVLLPLLLLLIHRPFS